MGTDEVLGGMEKCRRGGQRTKGIVEHEKRKQKEQRRKLSREDA